MRLIASPVVHDSSVRGFWIAVGIEGQRVLSKAAKCGDR